MHEPDPPDWASANLDPACPDTCLTFVAIHQLSLGSQVGRVPAQDSALTQLSQSLITGPGTVSGLASGYTSIEVRTNGKVNY